MVLALTIYSMQMYTQLLQLKQNSNVAKGFKDAFTTINNYIQNPVISINRTDYTLEFFLCADYKVCSLTFKAGNK